jgi:hypothetical protein
MLRRLINENIKKDYSLRKISKRDIEIDILVFTILLYLYRTTISFLKFPFILFFLAITFYILINYRNRLFVTIKTYFNNFYLPLLLAVILILSFLFSTKFFLVVFIDIFNSMLLLAMALFMFFIIELEEDFSRFVKTMIRYNIVFAIIISILLLSKYFAISFSSAEVPIKNPLWNYLILSMTQDYNFSLIPVFFGIISVIFFLIDNTSKFKSILLNIILSLYSITILFSESRRGIISLSLVLILLLILQIFTFQKRNSIAKKIGVVSRVFIILTLTITISIGGFIFLVPTKVKKEIIYALGISVKEYNFVMSTRLYKYSTIFSNNKFSHFQKIVWNEKSDPRDPDTGWGSRICTLQYPLSGKNVEIVPKDAIGYKMDNKSDASVWNGNAYSATDISSLFQGDFKSEGMNFFHASVYCYISEDFNGAWAQIYSGFGSEGNTAFQYDFKKKGTWQRLYIDFKCDSGIPPVFLSWAKGGSDNFSSLLGHIVFAYPEYSTINPNPNDPRSGWGTLISTVVYPLTGDNVEIVPKDAKGYKMDSTCVGTVWNNNSYSSSDISCLFTGDTIRNVNEYYTASVYCYVSKDFDGAWSQIYAGAGSFGNNVSQYDLSKKGTWQKLQIKFRSKSGTPPVFLSWAKGGAFDFSNLKGYVVFAYPFYSKVNLSEADIPSNKELRFNEPVHIQKVNILESKYSVLRTKNNFVQSKTICVNSLATNNPGLISINESALFNISISFNKYIESGFFSSFALIHNQERTDPIRKWIKKIISEDTTYFGYNSNILIDTSRNSLAGPRLMRWRFAQNVFFKEYTLKQEIFGGGFNFLNWFGYYFLKDKQKSDYPHNPFLAILLYSGICGLIVYLLFIFKAFLFYFKYSKKYTILTVLFLLTFLFSFFSSGSPFDPPVMGFFSILPFFINYIHGRK